MVWRVDVPVVVPTHQARPRARVTFREKVPLVRLG
jgi:hypothetical protein